MNPTWSDLMKFNLKENPIIFDIGGYLGQWTEIAKQYHPGCIIYVFEPVKSFYNIIVDKYRNDINVKIFNFGLSSTNNKININVFNDGSSVYNNISGEFEEIENKDIIEFLSEHKIYHVDLVKINIEGEEYNLLEHLIGNGKLTIFQNYCVQFHRFIPNYLNRRNDILDGVKKYYDRTINYEMIFECWSIKSIPKFTCIGDSHISIFTNTDTIVRENVFTDYNNFKVYRVGSWLAYNLIDRVSDIQKVIDDGGNNDIIISFGEIDCRGQVKRIADRDNKDVDVIIIDLVDRLFKFIYKLNYNKVIILSPAPELVENPHQYYYRDNMSDFDAPHGTMEERSYIKRKYQELIIDKCTDDILYCNLFDDINNTYNKSDLYLDDIHLRTKHIQYLVRKKLMDIGQYNNNINSNW